MAKTNPKKPRFLRFGGPRGERFRADDVLYYVASDDSSHKGSDEIEYRYQIKIVLKPNARSSESLSRVWIERKYRDEAMDYLDKHLGLVVG